MFSAYLEKKAGVLAFEAIMFRYNLLLLFYVWHFVSYRSIIGTVDNQYFPHSNYRISQMIHDVRNRCALGPCLFGPLNPK